MENLHLIIRLTALLLSLLVYSFYIIYYKDRFFESDPLSWSATYKELPLNSRNIFQVWIWSFSVLIAIAGNSWVWYTSSALLIGGVACFPTIYRRAKKHHVYHNIGAISSVAVFMIFNLIGCDIWMYILSLFIGICVITYILAKSHYIRLIENFAFAFGVFFIGCELFKELEKAF